MRVAFLVSVLVMLTMCGNPKKRATFQSQRGAYGQKIFHPSGRFVTSMPMLDLMSGAARDASTTGNTCVGRCQSSMVGEPHPMGYVILAPIPPGWWL